MINPVILILTFFALITNQAVKDQQGPQLNKQMTADIKSIIQDSYKLNSDDKKQNLVYIQKKLQQLSPGQYNIIIDMSDLNCNKWWIKWIKPNKYQTSWEYIIQKVQTCSLSQQIELAFDTKLQYVFGSGFNQQDKRVIQNLMSFILKQYDSTDKRIFQLKKQLSKYFKNQNQNWNVFNTPLFLGRAKFCAKDKKYFVRNGWTDDYIVYLS